MAILPAQARNDHVQPHVPHPDEGYGQYIIYQMPKNGESFLA